VGIQRLFSESHMTLLGQARQVVEKFLGNAPKPSNTQMSKAEAIAALRDKISARQEGRSDLLRISFRFPDPAVAAEFLNELANSLVGIQAGLVQLPGADEFFTEQAKRLEIEAEKAGAALKDFSIAASIYSATEQRSLLLKRASELSTLIASTRGSIEDRKGQKQAIIDQLLIMRPVTQSRTVTGIVGRLGGPDFKGREATAGASQFDEAPPLLLVRVYQDAMATLLKVNSELNGALKLETSLEEELDRVNAQLGDLTSREAEYDRLKRVLTRASSAADHYGVRMMEEQISQDSAKKTQLSSVRVVQLADKPIAPMLPGVGHLILLAMLGGIASGAALALLLELAQLRREQEEIDQFVANKLGQLSGRNAVMAAE
jgi:polysaccharide biosynthesis transport protein